MFTLVHGIFVIVLFGGGLEHHMGFPDQKTFWRVVQGYHLGWAILGLAISRGISFTANYIGSGEYKRTSLQQLMAQPYGRIFVLHLTIIFGGFLMMALHSPAWGLLLLVALKIALDLRGHLAERKKFAAADAIKAD